MANSVLFVCLGNICRSPTAEAVFKTKAKRAGLDIEIDSVGTGGWHIGEAPDTRAIQAGERRGYQFSGQSARKINAQDFRAFDYILAMDFKNLRDLLQIADPEYHDKIHLFLDFAPDVQVQDVPDPYYGGTQGFDEVLDLVEAASDGLIAHIQSIL